MTWTQPMPDFDLLPKSSFFDVQLHIVDAPLGAGPESITTIGSMDSGLALCPPRNDSQSLIPALAAAWPTYFCVCWDALSSAFAFDMSLISEKCAATASGVQSGSPRQIPSLSMLLITANDPAPAPMMVRVGAFSLSRYKTAGVIASGFISARTWGGTNPSVIRVAAVGEMVLTRMSVLRRAIIVLAEIPVEARGGRGDNDAAVIALAHAVPHRLAAIEGAGEMDIQHFCEIGNLHFRKGLVAQNAGIGAEQIDAAPLLGGAVHHRLDLLEVRDIGAVGDRPPAGFADFVDHVSRWGQRPAGAVAGAAEI